MKALQQKLNSQIKLATEAPQKTIIRVFKAIRHLATPPHKSIAQLATWLEVDKRTVYRYLNLLEEIGYAVDKDFEGRYFLFEDSKRNAVQFTTEETQLVRQILAAAPEQNPLVESIRRKVYLTSELIPLTDELVDIHRAKLIQQLAEAIAQRKQVKLLKYHSTNSDQVMDRLVEPLGFSDNFATLDAFELSSQKVKSFKIHRIEGVELLATAMVYNSDAPLTDAFGFTGEAFFLTLNLSTRAYHLLIEEFPNLRAFTQPQPNTTYPYRFVGEARSPIGIGRFCLGLPSEIEVVAPQSLKDYLNGRIEGVKW
jgi:proteasome accessory factor C